MIVVEILLSIAAAASVFCAAMLAIVYNRGEHLAKALEMQIRGLGATHLAGFEALTIEMQRLEARVKKVEDVMP